MMDNNCDEIPENFCVQDHINTNLLSKLRFYLSTKSKVDFKSGDKGHRWRQSLLVGDSQMYHKIDSSSDEDVTDTKLISSIIGSSSDRSQLRDEQDRAYEASLKADQEKEKQKIEKVRLRKR